MTTQEYLDKMSETEEGRNMLLIQANAGWLMYSRDEQERQRFREWATALIAKHARAPQVE